MTGAEAYRLRVGTTAGAHDIADSGAITATAFAVRDLQPGQTLYAQVATRLAGVWTLDAVTFTTATTARFTRPMAADGSDLGRGLALDDHPRRDRRTGCGSARRRARRTCSIRATRCAPTLETPALPAGQPIFAQVSTQRRRRVGRARDDADAGGCRADRCRRRCAGVSRAAAVAHVFTWTTITNAEA